MGHQPRSSCNIDAREIVNEARIVLIPAIALVDSFQLRVNGSDVRDLTTHFQESIERTRRITILSSDKHRLYLRLVHWMLKYGYGLICPEFVYQRLGQQRY